MLHGWQRFVHESVGAIPFIQFYICSCGVYVRLEMVCNILVGICAAGTYQQPFKPNIFSHLYGSVLCNAYIRFICPQSLVSSVDSWSGFNRTSH